MVELFPSPSGEAKAAHEQQRMLRTIGLTLGATAAGIAAAVMVPDLVVRMTGIPLPGWMFIRQVRAWPSGGKSVLCRRASSRLTPQPTHAQDVLVNCGTVIALFLISSFYR